MNTRSFRFVAAWVGTLAALSLALLMAPQEATKTFEEFLGLLFPQTISRASLARNYAQGNLSVLIVPGHDPTDRRYSGAEYRGIWEADLTLKTAEYLYGFFSQDPKFRAASVRDFATGRYTDEFSNYFAHEKDAIRQFRKEATKFMRLLVNANVAEEKSTPYHGFAIEDVAEQLYGINKWANEKSVDIVLHLHFNNYPRKNPGAPGIYSGSAIYIPENQFPNAVASHEVAASVFRSLRRRLSVSTAPFEASGIVEDQELIAVGANASLKKVSLLIEYGYLYEPQFTKPGVRDAFLKELAYLTYQGVKNYFEGEAFEGRARFTTSFLPHVWSAPIRRGAEGPHVLALQAALEEEGAYPPPGDSCPVNGVFGPCTEKAVVLFQSLHKIQGEIGRVGEATMRVLNERYSQ